VCVAVCSVGVLLQMDGSEFEDSLLHEMQCVLQCVLQCVCDYLVMREFVSGPTIYRDRLAIRGVRVLVHGSNFTTDFSTLDSEKRVLRTFTYKCVNAMKIATWKRVAICVYCMSQCVAVCCSVLQCIAVCCSVLQCVAVCCSVLQCVAVCCIVCMYIWNAAAYHDLKKSRNMCILCVAVYCSMLQCVAECCSVLQCVAVCCIIYIYMECISRLEKA